MYIGVAGGPAGLAVAGPINLSQKCFHYSIYIATPGLVSLARNTMRCLKPNSLGTRPRSSIPYNYVYVRISYARERNLSKKEAHGGPGPAILVHLELAVQSMKVPREPILITEK